jgi:Fur family ferric uptake transcriptional regulator
VAAQIDATALLERHAVRPTRQRVAVVEALAAEPNDATAQEIHGRLRERVGLATVYRTLTLLADAGVIDTLNHRAGEACYRLCGEGHHHHLVCGRCHRVVELGDCALEAQLSALAAQHGFTVSDHTVELTGLCSDCR